MKKKTVCFFNTCKSWGGGEKWHYDISTRLSDKGYDVIVVTNKRSELCSRIKKWSLRLYEIKISNLSFLNIFKILKVYKILKNEKIKTIIINLPSDLKVAGIAAKLAGIEKIIYRRGSATPVKNTFFNRFLFRYIITDVIANSVETKKTILQNNQNLIEPDKIRIVYNGIDLERYDENGIEPLYPRKKHEITLGTAGRLEKVKNQKYLIEVAGTLKQRKIPFKLLIAGKGSLEQDLKKYANEIGVENEVIFPGFIDDIRAFMESIDVFVLSSLYEGFGYVIIEAMASGKPVITFNDSSGPEIVENNKTGFLVDNRDMGDFVAKVEHFAHDPRSIEVFGEKGRKRVEEIFDIQMILRSIEKII